MIKLAKIMMVFGLVALLTSPAHAMTGETLPQAKGKVTGISLASHVLALDVKGKGFISFLLNDQTGYVNAESAEQVKKGDAVTVKYRKDGADNIAVSVKRNLVKLPEGIKELKTHELQALLNLGPEKGDFALIDARPAGKYQQEHIPGAISLPFTALKKEGESLLPQDKEKFLVFYCGGPT